MAAGNSDSVFFKPHQLSQHLGPWNDRDMGFSCCQDLDVVIFNRGRNHHDIGPFNPFTPVALPYRAAQFGKTPGNFSGSEIRTTDLISKIDEQLGNTAHSDPANAHKMNMLCFFIHV